jgi:hypothetical protein
VLVTGERNEMIAAQGWSGDGAEVLFTRLSPPLVPPQLTYRLFAVAARGGAPRSMAVSIPGFAWDHDLQIDPTGTVAAFDHFSRARVAELWVLRHLTHPLD